MVQPQATAPLPRPRSRTPLVVAAFVGGTAVFMGLKWRAVIARSEAAKVAGSKEGAGYAVVPGRSGGGI